MRKRSRAHTESENTRLVRVYTHIHSCPFIVHKTLGDHVHAAHDGIGTSGKTQSAAARRNMLGKYILVFCRSTYYVLPPLLLLCVPLSAVAALLVASHHDDELRINLLLLLSGGTFFSRRSFVNYLTRPLAALS